MFLTKKYDINHTFAIIPFLNLNTPDMKSIEINNDPAEAKIYRPVMAGVIAGIIATVLNLLYDLTYRSSTGFTLSAIINVASIIFGTMLVLLIIGFLFALMDRFLKQSVILHIIIFVVLTILCSWLAFHTHRSDNPVLTGQFRGLLAGIVIISGCCASILIPLFTKKENSFI